MWRELCESPLAVHIAGAAIIITIIIAFILASRECVDCALGPGLVGCEHCLERCDRCIVGARSCRGCRRIAVAAGTRAERAEHAYSRSRSFAIPARRTIKPQASRLGFLGSTCNYSRRFNSRSFHSYFCNTPTRSTPADVNSEGSRSVNWLLITT